MKDEQGNDLSAVPVPVGGLLAFAPYDPGNVIPDADIGKTPLELPDGYVLAGLIKPDGAPQHGRESGDALEFWQKGYSLPGDGTRTIQANLAENTPEILALVEGKEPNADGVIYVDSSLPEARHILALITKFKNGTEDRYNGVATITAIEIDQDTRGEARGRSVTFTWQEDDLFEGSPFKIWHGKPKVTPEP